MRFHITVLLVALLCLAQVGAARAQTEVAEPTAAASGSPTAAPATGRVQFVHDAEGTPAIDVELVDPRSGRIGTWRAAPGSTTELDPDVPLVPRTYRMRVLPTVGFGPEGPQPWTTFDVPVAAGFTTVVTAYADQHGRPLFILDTPGGEVVVRPRFAGTLVVEHDVDGGPTLDVVVWELELQDRAIDMGRLTPGGAVRDEVEAGPHIVLLYADGAEVARVDTFVVDDQTTTLRVSEMLGPTAGGGPLPRPATPTSAPSASPSAFPRPERIDTGAGGTADWAPWLLGAVVAGAAIAGGFAFAAARRRAPRPGG
jgi:hypothetical protein